MLSIIHLPQQIYSIDQKLSYLVSMYILLSIFFHSVFYHFKFCCLLRYQLILTHSTLIFLILFLFWFAFINSEKLRFMMKVCFYSLVIVFFTLFSFCNDDQVLIGNNFQNKLYQYICDHDWYQDFGYYFGF